MTRLSETERNLRRLEIERRLLMTLTPAFDPTRSREEIYADDEVWATVKTTTDHVLWDEQEVEDLLSDWAAAALNIAYSGLRAAEIEGTGIDVSAFSQRLGQAYAERIERESQP
jgi:hypothetical protein